MSELKNTSAFESDALEQDNQHQMITGMLMALEGFLSSLNAKVSDSLALHDIGEETEIVQSIKASLNSPISQIDNIAGSLSKSIRNIQVKYITAFIRKNKLEVDFTAYCFDENAMHVFIGLKTDSEENKDVFYSILDSYEEREISNIFPIIFHFIPKQMLELVENPHMISFDEQAH